MRRANPAGAALIGGLFTILGCTDGTSPEGQETGPAGPAAPGRVENVAAFIADPAVFAQFQEPTHAPRTIPYPSAEDARAANIRGTELETRWAASPFFQLLNGTWDFAFYDRPDAMPADLTDIAWGEIDVPRSWQTAGYDELVYRNTQLTWEALDQATDTVPPAVPTDYNPVGVYRRSFDAPAAWEGRRTFLHFEGIKQASFVWVNGSYVGYDQGSAEPSEYDVTDLLRHGEENTVTLQVYRFSDGEALETWDAMRFSGIQRSVYLFSKPEVHVRDFRVITDLDEAYENGTLTVEVDINNAGRTARDVRVEGVLLDAAGAPVATVDATATVPPGTEETVTLAAAIEAPSLWSAEKPNLYELTLTLADDAGGGVLEAMIEDVGFRKYEVSGGLFRVNGVPTTIRGVNRPEHSATHGRHVPFEMLLHDIRLMKQNEIDALRMSHYPNDPSVYVLADEFGLYVQDEIGVETHWNTELVNQTSTYDAQILERFQRMVQRDRNRPSIFTWSTGNEAGYGPVHDEMARWTGTLSGDYILYHQDNAFPTVDYSPLHGIRYPTAEQLRDLLATTDKPIIMGEYRHGFGNTMGGFDAFWEMILPPVPDPPAEYARLQGGFMWDWADQTVDRPGQAPFFSWDGLDGIVAGDRTPYPELAAVKDGHEPFALYPVDAAAGGFLLGNHYSFTNLSERELVWRVEADGETLEEGRLDVDVPPRSWVPVDIPFTLPEPRPGTDYWLTVDLRLADDTAYADAGHLIGRERVLLPVTAPAARALDQSGMSPVTATQPDEGTIILSGDRFSYTFDEAAGMFTALTLEGTTRAVRGPRLNLWRAPTLVDEAAFWDQLARKWREAGLDDPEITVRRVEPSSREDGTYRVVVTQDWKGPGGPIASVTLTHTIHPSGDIITDVSLQPAPGLASAVPSLPRIGIALEVPASMERMAWYGRGPVGSFPDRIGGTWPGLYERTVSEVFEPVLPPQTYGVMTESRWGSVADDGFGLMVSGDAFLAFSVDPFANLAAAQSIEELSEADTLTVMADHRFLNAGTKFHPGPSASTIPPADTGFSVRIRPFDPSSEEPRFLWKETVAAGATTE